MTLSQLRAFALVARLGSMRAAALALGVSEPAVSSAIAALRNDLGDPLVVRAGGGIALTPGGRRLATHADEIVGLADRARREVAAAATPHDVLRVAVTPSFHEHAAEALFDAFTSRSPGTQVEVHRSCPERLAGTLLEHAMALALGVRPTGSGIEALDVTPFLRYERLVVVAAGHPLATGGPVSRTALLREPWLAGPAGIEELSDEGSWLAGSGLVPDVHCRASEAEALDEVRAGSGVALALGHVVRQDLRAGTLVRLPVTGTPVQGLWCASLLGQGRSAAGARALQRFCTTPDAVAAMVATAHVPRPRRPPTVHVNLWS
jgi:LysR family transcriptional regulator, low CO2-responsive transcriptional regulator